MVANPQSAGGALGRRWPQVARLLDQHLGDYDHAMTTAAGEAVTLTREALLAGKHEMIVAMGGDGTISDVVDGFFSESGAVQPEVVLGVLHFGTGGDFRKTIGAPKELAKGVRSLAGRETQWIDVGRLTHLDHQGQSRTRHFVNIASFGMGGLVDQLVNTTTKAFGGRVSFGVATLRAMRRYRAKRARVQLDNGEPREILLHNVAVANGRFFGGGMQVAPGACLDDGVFDVVTIGPLSNWDILARGHLIYTGRHLNMPQVTLERAARVVAEPVNAGDEILLDVDGETPGRLPATFEILPSALRLKTPA